LDWREKYPFRDKKRGYLCFKLGQLPSPIQKVYCGHGNSLLIKFACPWGATAIKYTDATSHGQRQAKLQDGSWGGGSKLVYLFICK